MTADRSGEGSGRAPFASSWVRVAALVLTALVALWFCIRATTLQLVERDYPLIGEAWSPPSPVSLALISLNRASATNGVADPLAQIGRAHV